MSLPSLALLNSRAPVRSARDFIGVKYTYPSLETRDGKGVFVDILKHVKWALENVRGAGYMNFPHTINLLDTSDNNRLFATITYEQKDRDHNFEGNGWTFQVVGEDETVYQQGGRFNGEGKDAEKFLDLAVQAAYAMVDRLKINRENVELVWPNNNTYVAAYEEFKAKNAVPASIDADANNQDVESKHVKMFDDRVERYKERYPHKIWVCTLLGKSLRCNRYSKGAVTAKAVESLIVVTVVQRQFFCSWEYEDLFELAYSASNSTDPETSLNDLAENWQAIVENLKVEWKPRVSSGNYDRVQMSNPGLVKLKKLWRDEAFVDGLVRRMDTQSHEALVQLAERPAARRAIGWGVVSGLVKCFGGDMNDLGEPWLYRSM